MGFDYEPDFEEALIKLLKDYGWTGKMLNYPTEEQLIKNWAEIRVTSKSVWIRHRSSLV